MPDLHFAGNDATEFARIAETAMKGRNKDIDLQTLCQQACNALPTYANVRAALEKIARSDEHDTVIVFLSGHGESVGGKYFFLPSDLQRAGADVRTSVNALDWSLVEDALGRAKGAKILFVDTCHSGASFNATLRNNARQNNLIAFSSTGPNQLSWEDPQVKHGLFTYWLIKGLGGDAEETDRHTIKVYGLGNFLAQKVGEQTAHPPFTHQEPIFESLLDSNPAIAWH
jgi:uncharacterized caspase-like protein